MRLKFRVKHLDRTNSSEQFGQNKGVPAAVVLIPDFMSHTLISG